MKQTKGFGGCITCLVRGGGETREEERGGRRVSWLCSGDELHCHHSVFFFPGIKISKNTLTREVRASYHIPRFPPMMLLAGAASAISANA